jgi:hypothetical protein
MPDCNEQRPHVHTDAPALNAPWCAICNAFLTWAIIDQEEGTTEKENDDEC